MARRRHLFCNYHLVDEQNSMGKVVSDQHKTDIMVEELTGNYNLVKVNASNNNPEYGWEDIHYTMQNM